MKKYLIILFCAMAWNVNAQYTEALGFVYDVCLSSGIEMDSEGLEVINGESGEIVMMPSIGHVTLKDLMVVLYSDNRTTLVRDWYPLSATEAATMLRLKAILILVVHENDRVHFYLSQIQK